MKIKVLVVIESENKESETLIEEISCWQRQELSSETLGLTLAEGKEILTRLQEQVITHQVADYLAQYQFCPHCHQPQRRNGHQNITYRTLFGQFTLCGQRFYHCDCQTHEIKTFSPLAQLLPERTAPEFNYLQAKWASLMSYGLTVNLLEEVFPLSANIATTYRHTQKVAQRLEDELGEEQHLYIKGSSSEWAKLPPPQDRLFVGLDGGFVRGREKDKPKADWFEIIVGKSLLNNQPSKRFAFVQTYDEKPQRRLFEMLQSQGMQMNQDITFLSDGGEDVRQLQYDLNPQAEHILDWFHITMKITVMQQIAKGLKDRVFVEKMLTAFDQVRWRLWHGQVTSALDTLDGMLLDGECETTVDSKRDKLLQTLSEYHRYITNNQAFIPNYAERYRYGELISTSFAESAVNEIVSKRMVKKQQMCWTKKGAHLLLQVRVKSLNGELRSKYEEWYPGLASKNMMMAEMQGAVATG